MRLGKLCIAVQGSTPAELLDRVEAVLPESRFIELRLDALAKPVAALPQVRKLLAARRDVVAIATCRRKAGGGHFVGSLNAELEILQKAAEAGCHPPGVGAAHALLTAAGPALEALEDRGDALPAADAGGDHPVPPTAAAQLVEELRREDRAGSGDRVAERDRAAVHVHPLGI